MTITLHCENEIFVKCLFSIDISHNKSQEKMNNIVFRCGFGKYAGNGPHSEQQGKIIEQLLIKPSRELCQFVQSVHRIIQKSCEGKRGK